MQDRLGRGARERGEAGGVACGVRPKLFECPGIWGARWGKVFDFCWVASAAPRSRKVLNLTPQTVPFSGIATNRSNS